MINKNIIPQIAKASLGEYVLKYVRFSCWLFKKGCVNVRKKYVITKRNSSC